MNDDGADDTAEKPETSTGTRSGSAKLDYKVCFVCEKTGDKTGNKTLTLVAEGKETEKKKKKG